MWTNRISPFVNQNAVQHVERASPAVCSLDVPPGAFLVPPVSGFTPAIYELARQQALFELKRRRRAVHYGRN